VRADQLEPHRQLAAVGDAVAQAGLHGVGHTAFEYRNADGEFLGHVQLTFVCSAGDFFFVGQLVLPVGQADAAGKIDLLLGLQAAADLQHVGRWWFGNVGQVVFDEGVKVSLAHWLAAAGRPGLPLG